MEKAHPVEVSNNKIFKDSTKELEERIKKANFLNSDVTAEKCVEKLVDSRRSPLLPLPLLLLRPSVQRVYQLG